MRTPVPSTPRDELAHRITALQRHLPTLSVEAALISQNTDLFYFAGSMQSGFLLVPARGRPIYAVRRVLERAREESALEQIVPLESLQALPALLRDAVGGPLSGWGQNSTSSPSSSGTGWRRCSTEWSGSTRLQRSGSCAR